MSIQIEIVKKYIALVEAMNFTPDTAADLVHPDYEQWELPNQLNKQGQKSDLADSFKRMKIATTIMREQKYQITSTMEQDSRVVMEAIWAGKFSTDIGPFKAGQELKAFFCMIFEFKDQKIYRIRNYDCFEPF